MVIPTILHVAHCSERKLVKQWHLITKLQTMWVFQNADIVNNLVTGNNIQFMEK